MNWGLLVTNFILAGIVGVCIPGEWFEARWWVPVLLFCITMSFRDYFLKGGLGP